MAMHMGMGFSKIILLLGAGYTGTIMLKNGQLSDILGGLQLLVKGMEKSGDSADSESDIVAQVRRLAMEVRQVASARQITVLNGGSSEGNMSSLVMPAAAAGALGYGYMWWKGLSFSDLMYVTKRSMSAAVSNMTKHLEQVSEALAATKKHLTQRLLNLDEKLDGQKEMSKEIKEEVCNVRADLSQIGYDLDSLQKLVSGLDGKMGALGEKQDFANVGVWYLCNLVGAKEGKMPPCLKALPKPNNPRGYIGYSGTPNMKGLKQISDVLKSGDIDNSISASMQNDFNTPNSQPRSLSRISSFKS